jgi:hypothetical protein
VSLRKGAFFVDFFQKKKSYHHLRFIGKQRKSEEKSTALADFRFKPDFPTRCFYPTFSDSQTET